MTDLAASTCAPRAAETEFGPWNPGIESWLPRPLLPLSTIFRPENVFTSLEHAQGRRDLTGLEFEEVVAFRPQRLVLHELLIRVTADLSVPDGPRLDDLGISFRHMTSTILDTYIVPHMATITAAYDSLRRKLTAVIDAELSAAFAASHEAATGPGVRRKGSLLGLFCRARQAAPTSTGSMSVGDREERLLRAWDAKAQSDEDELRRAAYRALARVGWALFKCYGRLWGAREQIASLAVDIACNDHGGEEIGRLIEPYLIEAARRQGYHLLPAQERPVVMNTKGASASGKSTMRPLQKTLAERIGVSWSDFALISPDIWRKQLIDYSSLGPSYKYAGAFTSEELRIVDQKLDRYMARKAQRGGMSHLLIDRFRFDSFAPDSDEAGSNLLTRFGRIVYLFFMITPPEATVDRAWKRGLEVGRYKAVDDLLGHNVEAYSGTPNLFFTWVRRQDKQVHYEFLDNSVALGERPRTIAFGWNGEMNVLDVQCMLNVERYRRLNINAKGPRDLYPDPRSIAAENNANFLVQCARRLPALNFADQESGRIYLRLVSGAPVWADRELLRKAMADPGRRAALAAVAPGALDGSIPGAERPMRLEELLDPTRIHTLGRWGDTH